MIGTWLVNPKLEIRNQVYPEGLNLGKDERENPKFDRSAGFMRLRPSPTGERK
jgi:hypothetical protein